jgi:WD40 repeat protein
MPITGDDEGKLVIWDVTTGARLQTLNRHTAMIRLIVAPKECEGLLVNADITGTIIAWTYEGEWKLSWKVSKAHAFSVSAMSIKDKVLLTGGADGKIRIWGLEGGELLREIEETYDAVYDVAFQEDLVGNEIVVVASRNGRTVLDVS